MATNHSEESANWWILGEEFVNPPLMAHFAFEQQLSEAVGGLGYISLPFQNSFLEFMQVRMDSSISVSSTIGRQSLKPNISRLNVSGAGLNRFIF